MKLRLATVRWYVLVGGIAALLLISVIFKPRILISAVQFLKGRASVSERVAQYGPTAEPRLKERFAAAGVAYPPKTVTLLAIKQEWYVWLYASDGGALKQIVAFPIKGASGTYGPKLVQGDRQVPEGFYRIESLNPNSLYHLSMRLDYPNQEDRNAAATDGRTDLGGDTMIHGKTGSVGCIAMGDPAIEELFILAARVGVENVDVVIAPAREPWILLADDAPGWLRDRYSRLKTRLEELKPVASPSAESAR